MPELTDDMYCHQQICIPPTFPYLLRQFAKAAIRTQPNDLLKWSTTYFRCLSLNIPPPVKPRLEYPIPRDHHGMTPGWLRALLHQMEGNTTVTFKLLWDRWIGACLQHPNLIQILVLGGFEDNMAVPWLRFIGLCAGHLTENLTQTMILICEILTEEPEGGSAMIPADIFIDLYQFLARIDASIPQTLKNYYFLDKFLELWQEKIARDAGEKPEAEEPEEMGFSVASSEMSVRSEKEAKKEDEISEISCPSVTSQDPDNYMKLLMKIRADGEYEGTEAEKEEEEEEEAKAETASEKPEPESEVPSRRESISTKQDEGDENKDEPRASIKEEPTEQAPPGTPPPKTFADQLEEDKRIALIQTHDQDDTVSRGTRGSSVLEKSSRGTNQKEDQERDEFLKEDLERLRAIQQELMGESDDELEKFKASILADAGLTPSQIVAPEHFETKIEEPDLMSSETTKSASTTSVPSEPEKPVVPEREYEDVFVDAVPGIGAKVPEDMIKAVIAYVKSVAKVQHNMIMPRNIRHFECPPLEVYFDRD